MVFMSRKDDTKPKKKLLNNVTWTILAFIVLIGILLIPTPDNLPVVAHMALAILAFAIIMWVTEAVSYPTSSVMILVLIILFIGFSPTEKLDKYLIKGNLSK